jgi:hypothetical protein
VIRKSRVNFKGVNLAVDWACTKGTDSEAAAAVEEARN